MSTPAHSQTASSRGTTPELGTALERGLGQPIHALRASMESLAGAFDLGDPRTAALDSALSEVTRIGRSVSDLLDYAHPPEPCPLECSIDEVLYSARFQLPHGLWSHLFIARDKSFCMDRLFVDGPVLARSIARLVQSTISVSAARGDVEASLMLRATVEHGRAVFTITMQHTSDPVRQQADPTGLCHSIAQRDLGVIGCTLEERTTPSGDLAFRIQLPSDALVLEDFAA